MRAEINELQPAKITEQLLNEKVVLLLHGENACGQSLAVFLAKSGANIALVYRVGFAQKASDVKQRIEELGQRCLLIEEQKGDDRFSKYVVRKTINALGRLDIFIDCSTGNVKDFGKVDSPAIDMSSEEIGQDGLSLP